MTTPKSGSSASVESTAHEPRLASVASAAKRPSARTLFSAGRLSLSFAWYDLWIGLYIDPVKGTVYICPLPTLLITWRRSR